MWGRFCGCWARSRRWVAGWVLPHPAPSRSGAPPRPPPGLCPWPPGVGRRVPGPSRAAECPAPSCTSGPRHGASRRTPPRTAPPGPGRATPRARLRLVGFAAPNRASEPPPRASRHTHRFCDPGPRARYVSELRSAPGPGKPRSPVGAASRAVSMQRDSPHQAALLDHGPGPSRRSLSRLPGVASLRPRALGRCAQGLPVQRGPAPGFDAAFLLALEPRHGPAPVGSPLAPHGAGPRP